MASRLVPATDWRRPGSSRGATAAGAASSSPSAAGFGAPERPKPGARVEAVRASATRTVLESAMSLLLDFRGGNLILVRTRGCGHACRIRGRELPARRGSSSDRRRPARHPPRRAPSAAVRPVATARQGMPWARAQSTSSRESPTIHVSSGPERTPAVLGGACPGDRRQVAAVGLAVAEAAEFEVAPQADAAQLDAGAALPVAGEQREHEVVALRKRREQLHDARQDAARARVRGAARAGRDRRPGGRPCARGSPAPAPPPPVIRSRTMRGSVLPEKS